MGRHQQPFLELACDQPLLRQGDAKARQCRLYAQVGVGERQRLAQGHGLAREGFPLVPGAGRVLMCNARAISGPAPGIGRSAHEYTASAWNQWEALTGQPVALRSEEHTSELQSHLK